jgi:hypothetical protein
MTMGDSPFVSIIPPGKFITINKVLSWFKSVNRGGCVCQGFL